MLRADNKQTKRGGGDLSDLKNMSVLISCVFAVFSPLSRASQKFVWEKREKKKEKKMLTQTAMYSNQLEKMNET